MKENSLSERLKEVTLLFLRLGPTSIGGPAAYIDFIHQEDAGESEDQDEKGREENSNRCHRLRRFCHDGANQANGRGFF